MSNINIPMLIWCEETLNYTLACVGAMRIEDKETEKEERETERQKERQRKGERER